MPYSSCIYFGAILVYIYKSKIKDRHYSEELS